MGEVAPGIPLNRVGRATAGQHAGFYVEVDDDTQRPGGTGGYYVLYWRDGEGYDDWYEDASGFPDALAADRVEWFSEAASNAIPGAHPHGPAIP